MPMNLRKLPRSFYLRPTLTVARELLGKYLCRRRRRSIRIGRIVEVEAYLGRRDPASHAFGGRTKRNDVMFWQGGHLYVYFTYGMHFCANVVTGPQGSGRAVLLRAVEPVEGSGEMARERGLRASDAGLTNGPAKLCEAFGIARPENGTDLLGNEIFLAEATPLPPGRIGRSPRIGIRRGTEKRWRFFIRGNRYVSTRPPRVPP
jgi:DNA-3-methyladenine glycosylase